MDAKDLFEKYFWLLIIIVTLVNVRILQTKVKDKIESDPFRADGYHKLISGLAILIIVPACVMGIGAIFGDVSFTRDILYRSWNFYAILFRAMVLLEAIALFIWAWFLNGAAFFAKYSQVFNLPSDVRIIKLISAGFLGWSIYLLFPK